MKLKNVSFIEQHVEKVVLGVGALFFLVVIWLFLLGSPYAVEVGSQKLKPVEVVQVVRDSADMLNTLIESQRSPLERTPVPDYNADFAQRLAGALLPENAYQMPLARPGLDPKDVKVPELEDVTYELAEVPAPTIRKARADFAVLLPQEALVARFQAQLANNFETPDELRQRARAVAVTFDTILPQAKPPRDFRYVTVGGQFSLEDYARRFIDLPETTRVPEDWWRLSLALVDVVLERQTLDLVTDTWGQARIIDPLPGARTFRDPPTSYAPGVAAQYVMAVRANQPAIAQPQFVPVSEVRPYQPPDIEVGEIPQEVQKQLQDIDDQIELLRNRLRRITGSDEAGEASQRRIGPGGPPASKPGLEGRPTGPTAASQRQQQAQAQRQERIDRLRAELAELRQQRTDLLATVPRRGQPAAPTPPDGGPVTIDPTTSQPMPIDPEGFVPGRTGPGTVPSPYGPFPPGTPGAPGVFPGGPGFEPGFATQPGGVPGKPAAPAAAPGMPPVELYAHDLTVEPGKTYRYRIKVAVLNPLFQKMQVGKEQREKYLNKLALDSPWSDWTDPVSVPPESYFFLVGAQSNMAELEIWRVFDGQWRSTTLRLGPGDPIGGKISFTSGSLTEEVQIKIDHVVVDVLERVPPGSGGGGTVAKLIILDTRTGLLVERSTDTDAKNPNRLRLRTEAASTVAIAPGTP